MIYRDDDSGGGCCPMVTVSKLKLIEISPELSWHGSCGLPLGDFEMKCCCGDGDGDVGYRKLGGLE